MAAACALAASSAFAGGNDRFVDVIVSLKDAGGPEMHASNRAAAAEFARSQGISARFTYGTVMSGFAASVPEGRLDALRNHPQVQSVSMDAPVYAIAPPCHVTGTCDDGGDGETVPWGVSRISADTNTNTGTGIHVYIIDTGIDGNHADLKANLGNGYAVEKCKGGSCSADWHDDHGHGTHVAGTVGAIDNDIDVLGVAPEVTLHAVKVLSKSGSGTRSGVIAGVDWVAEQAVSLGQAVVANMSLGGSGSKTSTCSDTGFSGSDDYHRAICNARHVGVVFAVAAGNDGADAAGSVPAAYDDTVVTVSATMEGDDWTSWSNWGDESASWTSNVSAPVGIAAPGASILSTKLGGGTTTMSGTSMAAPHVAGGLALFLASNRQSNDGSAFLNARSALLSGAESTSTFSNTSGNPHDEDFLDAGSL